jgi:hypothetical protein
MSSEPLLTTLLATLEREEAVARVVVVEGQGTGTWALVRAGDAPGWDTLGAGEEVLAEARAAIARRHPTTTPHGAMLQSRVRAVRTG